MTMGVTNMVSAWLQKGRRQMSIEILENLVNLSQIVKGKSEKGFTVMCKIAPCLTLRMVSTDIECTSLWFRLYNIPKLIY